MRHFNFQYFSWTNQAKTSWKFKNCLNLKFTGSYEKEDSVIHLPWHVSTIAIASIHNYYIDFEQKCFAQSHRLHDHIWYLLTIKPYAQRKQKTFTSAYLLKKTQIGVGNSLQFIINQTV